MRTAASSLEQAIYEIHARLERFVSVRAPLSNVPWTVSKG